MELVKFGVLMMENVCKLWIDIIMKYLVAHIIMMDILSSQPAKIILAQYSLLKIIN